MIITVNIIKKYTKFFNYHLNSIEHNAVFDLKCPKSSGWQEHLIGKSMPSEILELAKAYNKYHSNKIIKPKHSNKAASTKRKASNVKKESTQGLKQYKNKLNIINNRVLVIVDDYKQKIPEILNEKVKQYSHPLLGTTQYKDFYKSTAWRQLRYLALRQAQGKCQCCGVHSSNSVLHVDHIKPRSRYPELELSLDNLQLLCEDCNLGKGDWDTTDWKIVV